MFGIGTAAAQCRAVIGADPDGATTDRGEPTEPGTLPFRRSGTLTMPPLMRAMCVRGGDFPEAARGTRGARRTTTNVRLIWTRRNSAFRATEVRADRAGPRRP